MKKWIYIILIAGGLYYLHENRPLREMHLQTLYFQATGEEASEEILAMEQWNKLYLRDFFIITSLGDTDQLNLVSYGFFNRVSVVDKEWTAKAFKLLPSKEQ